MALLQSLPLPLGTPIIPFTLPDPDGKLHSSADYADRKVLVIMFICNHCPYVQAVRERLIALQAGYDPGEVQLIGINSNDADKYPDDSPEAMKKAIIEFGINFPYLIDESQDVAKSYQAQCTPDIYVFSKNPPFPNDPNNRNAPNYPSLRYHGRIDDNWKEPEKVTKQELKTAIDALVRGEPAPSEQIFSIGCSIKWKNK